MTQAAWEKPLHRGKVHYSSRSRNRLWLKGETSGYTQDVKEGYVDCDADTILLKVHQHGGAACHEGYRNCFFRQYTADGDWRLVGERAFDTDSDHGERHRLALLSPAS